MAKKLKRFQVWCWVFNPPFLLAAGTRICAFCSADGSARLGDACAGDPTACGCTGWRLTQADIVCMPHTTSLAHPRLTSQPLPRHASFGENPGGTHIPESSTSHQRLSRKTHPMVPGAWRGARHRRGPVNARPSRTLRSGAPAQLRRWLGIRGDAAGNAASRLCHRRPSEKSETKASQPLTSPPAPGEPRRAAATPHRTEGRGAGFAPALCRRRHPGPLRLQTPSAATAAAAAPASTNGGRRYRFLSPLPSFPVPCFRRARNRLRPAAEARPCPAAETPLPTRRCRPSTATAPGSPRRSLPARGPRLAPPCRDRRQPRGAATDPQRRSGRWARERPLGTRGTVGRAGDRWAREGRLARAEPIDPRGADPCGADPHGAHRSPRCRSPRSPSIPAVPIDPCGAIAR